MPRLSYLKAMNRALGDERAGQRLGVAGADHAAVQVDLGEAGAHVGVDEHLVAVADGQTAGRGRHGRTWTAAPGAHPVLSGLSPGAQVITSNLLNLRHGLPVQPSNGGAS